MEERTQVTETRRNWRDIYRQPNRPGWVGNVIKIILGLIIIIALIFLGRFIHHSLKHKPSVTPAPANTKDLPKTPAEQSQSSNSGSSTNSSTANKPAGQGASDASQLPNSGPGDVAAVFLASSFTAAGLHYVITARKPS